MTSIPSLWIILRLNVFVNAAISRAFSALRVVVPRRESDKNPVLLGILG